MNYADSLLGIQPDSSLSLLKKIPTSRLTTEEEKARYALLMTIALDKNYIDKKSFDIIQPAINYYIKNGSPDEQFRTYYYQGRIYQNQGNDAAAMSCFMNACDLSQNVTDSLLLAHALVARGTLYFKQYKTIEFINNNIKAAHLYKAVGKDILRIKSCTNALDGYILMNNKSAADSLISICIPLVQKNTDAEVFLFPSLLSYTINFCSPQEIKEVLTKYQNMELTTDETMIFAQGYSKIGEYDKAISFLSRISVSESAWDSLKYASIKINILEKQGKYEQAFKLYKNYSATLERHQKELISQDLLFSDEKHQLEMKNLMEIQGKDRIIWGTICSIFTLIILIGWMYYRGYRSKTKRILTEKENENLRLEKDNLRKEKEKAELERDKKKLEADNLEKDKKRLEAEQCQHELETANLKLEIAQLERESDKLKELQTKQLELTPPIKNVIKDRLELLNSLLAKEITNNDSYAKPYNIWIETIHSDKQKFMDSTRLAYAASHPKFLEYLEQHGLSTDEINYLCLYAIGLRGKDVGEYIQMKRHYIISHEIRMKLGIDEHETNLGLYIRRLIKHFEK